LIHPSALIDAEAELADGVEVGPFSVVGASVRIGAGTIVGPHVVIQGPTTIGPDNRFHPFGSIGGVPQDKKYAGESTRLEIGSGNTFFESVTISRGTTQDAGATRIGDDNWIMAYVHIAHDCMIGSHTILANCATLGGHVSIGDWAILGGFSKVHQYCRVGPHSFCGMDCGIKRDVPPFVTVSGHPAEPRGINSEGLKRRGFEPATQRAIRDAYRLLYRSGLRLEEALEQLQPAAAEHAEVAAMVEFIRGSDRSIVR
jgi:UDP-N-acetylglucosamine acyltransferase